MSHWNIKSWKYMGIFKHRNEEKRFLTYKPRNRETMFLNKRGLKQRCSKGKYFEVWSPDSSALVMDKFGACFHWTKVKFQDGHYCILWVYMSISDAYIKWKKNVLVLFNLIMDFIESSIIYLINCVHKSKFRIVVKHIYFGVTPN